MSNTIRRDILTKPNIIDREAGIVEITATTAAIDSCFEVVDPGGVELDRFSANAPVCDSHDCDSISSLLGQCIGSRIEDGALVLRIKFAVDVESNTLAKLAFDMICAGYDKTCSIGFIPLEICRPGDSDFKEVCEQLGLGDQSASIRCVYVRIQLLEVSIVCIGANPEALVRAQSANMIDAATQLRFPALRRALQAAESNPSIDPIPRMSRKSFADTISVLTGSNKPKTVVQASEDLEFARRGQSQSDQVRASVAVRCAMARERGTSAHDLANQFLSDPLLREYFNTLPRFVCGVGCRGVDFNFVRKSLVPGSGLGAGLLPVAVCSALYTLAAKYGMYSQLGVTEMGSQFTKIGQLTSYPSAIWITPSNQGLTTIPDDSSLAGIFTTPESNTLAIRLAVTRELLADEKVSIDYWFFTIFSQAIAKAIDFVCCQGNGVDDQVNGLQTGIWNDANIATVNAAQGNTTIANLERTDFINAIAAVAPAALQRECKWIISPALLAQLMLLKDPTGHGFLVKTPAETGDGTFRLVGFEIVLAAQAPAVQTPGSTIAAFGSLDAYQVGMRDSLEVILRDGPTGFASNEQSFRALARCFCQTRAATGLSKLALAAS